MNAIIDLLEMTLDESEFKALQQYIAEEKRDAYANGTRVAVNRLRKQGMFEVRSIIERASSFEELKQEAETEYLQSLSNPYLKPTLL